jgi:two-component system sensor histidine kinase VicK
MRWVTEVTPNNISYCKKLTEISEVRHLDGIRTNFGIAEGKQTLLHGVSQEKDPLSQAILTSVKGLVEAQQYMLKNLWNKAIPAIQKIKEIEEGIKPDVIETITDPIKIQNLYLNLLRFATKEIMLIIPTANTMNHQADAGVFGLLKEMFEENNNNEDVKIRVLIPQIIIIIIIQGDNNNSSSTSKMTRIFYCPFLFLLSPSHGEILKQIQQQNLLLL